MFGLVLGASENLYIHSSCTQLGLGRCIVHHILTSTSTIFSSWTADRNISNVFVPSANLVRTGVTDNQCSNF
jgi:hypothetical protein